MRETPDDPEGAPPLASSPLSPDRKGAETVAMVVVLLPASEADPSLQPAAMSELARLGVTNVAVLRDERTVGLVVEGWAFDPCRSAEAVVAAVASPGARVRTLHPLLQMAVSAAPLTSGGES